MSLFVVAGKYTDRLGQCCKPVNKFRHLLVRPGQLITRRLSRAKHSTCASCLLYQVKKTILPRFNPCMTTAKEIAPREMPKASFSEVRKRSFRNRTVFNANQWKTGTRYTAANGDKALDQALDSLQQLQESKPRFDHRYTIEHFSISNSMQPRRIKELGAIVSANIYFAHYRSQLHAHEAYGPDRAEAFGRLGSLAREGVTFAIHSDYPQVVVPMLPLTGAWTAVNRFSEDGKTVVGPGERISVERAMRAITIDAAYILGVEDKVGSLEMGKFADFAILEGDPYEVDPTELKDVPVWGTALGGKVFKSPE